MRPEPPSLSNLGAAAWERNVPGFTKMQASLTHIALHVRDPNACVAFYQSYCGLKKVHGRRAGEESVVWLAEPGREHDFIIVVLPGGPGRNQSSGDYSHLGFAL